MASVPSPVVTDALEDTGRNWDDQAEHFDDEADHELRDPAVRAAWAALLLPRVVPEAAAGVDVDLMQADAAERYLLIA
jgi:hypothetical protein